MTAQAARLRRKMESRLSRAKRDPGVRQVLAEYRAEARLRRKLEVEPVQDLERIPWDQVSEVVEVSCAVSVWSKKHHLATLDAEGRYHITERQAYMAAIRAQLHRALEYGPGLEAWLVKGYFAGERVVKIYVGTLAALRSVWVDHDGRMIMEQAGAKDLGAMVGVPLYIEKLPRERRHEPKPKGDQA